MKTRTLWLILAALALLTPVGLWLPELLRAGDAWGEWSAQDLERQVGFVPRQLGRMADLWKGPLPDYAPAGWEQRPLLHRSFAYIGSALAGVAICAGLLSLLMRWLARGKQSHAP